MEKKTNKSKKRIGRPPAFIYYVAFFFVSLYYRIVYRVRIDRSGLRGIRGPAVVVAPHISGKDHVLTALALFPHRPTFVLSEHFMANPSLRRVLRMMHVITKKMFYPDASAVMNMMRAAREGNIIVLFPEGRLTWYGRSLDITAGTAGLLRQLGVNVYVITSDGAGLTFPKWGKKPRPGRINVRTSKLFDGDEVRDMTVESIESALREALRHDEETAMPGVRYRSDATTDGLDGILWLCPVCGGEHTLRCENNHIICRECALDCTLDERYRLSGAPEGIGSVAGWYEHNAAALDITRPLTSRVSVGTTDGDGYMQRGVGEGTLTLSAESVDFCGTLNGEALEFSLPVTKVVAFPVTVGDHIDVYYRGRLLYLSPQPDPRDSVKFVAYLDRVIAARAGE